MGARISTGADSKQDYRTPDDFIKVVEKRFGRIRFDLAACSYNKQSDNYFAPCTGSEGPLPFDPKAFGHDAFDHSWAQLSTNRFRNEGRRGLLWLNPEFAQIVRWGERVRNESILGARIAFLTPAAMGANWFTNIIARYADVYLLNGRLSFIPGKPYNKDCMLSIFDPDIVSERPHQMHVWDWRNDLIQHTWQLV